MILLVTGDRHYARKARVDLVLDKLHRAYGIKLVIHGAAAGADTLAEAWARRRQIDYNGRPAKWTENGNGAGPIRNQAMLQELLWLSGLSGSASGRTPPTGPTRSVVVAFHDNLEWSKGTKDMTNRALSEGLPVLLVEKDSARWLSEARPERPSEAPSSTAGQPSSNTSMKV